MASQRSDGRWVASLYRKGHPRLWFYGSTQEEAEAKKSAYLSQNEPVKLAPGSVGEFVFAAWWPRILAKTKPPTQKRYSDIWRLHVSPTWQDAPLSSVKLEQVQSWLGSLELSPKSKELCKLVLSSILNLAEQLGRIPRNEAKWATLPKSKPKRRVDLNLSKIHKLMKAAEGTDMEGPVFAAAYLGMRRGEVCGLKVTDLEDGAIHIRRTRNKQYEGSLKSKAEGEERVLPVPPAMLARIRSFAQEGSIYVFSWNGGPLNPDRLTHNMEQLCAKAGIERLTFHDLRAAAGSNLRRLGVDPWTIMRILGHTKIDTTTIYQDEGDEEVREALGRMVGG